MCSKVLLSAHTATDPCTLRNTLSLSIMLHRVNYTLLLVESPSVLLQFMSRVVTNHVQLLYLSLDTSVHSLSCSTLCKL